MGPVSARLAYVELSVADCEASARFFERAFGWSMQRFGPTYAATVGEAADLGLDGDRTAGAAVPLPGLEVSDLEAAVAAAETAGAVVTRPIFAFPGGRRAHVREPGGNELSLFVTETVHP